ncbi:hypothetical protein NST28_31555 [Paenibacillus sp. FSL R10-2791]|uniref:hypothetical protein n=1 Tax=unclassified Paenibacillus TaxID=185978 RepID=UPI0030FB55C9
MPPLTAGSLAAATHALLDAIQRTGPGIAGASISSSLMCLQDPDLSIALAKCCSLTLDPLQLTLSWMLLATAGESIRNLQQLTLS